MSFSTVYVEYSDSLSVNLSGPTSHDTLDVCDTGVLTTILDISYYTGVTDNFTLEKNGLKCCAEFEKMARRICKSRTQNLQFFGAEFWRPLFWRPFLKVFFHRRVASPF